MSELLKKQNYGVENMTIIMMQLQKLSELQLPDQIALATRQEPFRIHREENGR